MHVSKVNAIALCLAGSWALAAGCGNHTDDVEDTGADTALDTDTADADTDVAPDTDPDTEPDTAEDADTDTEPDVGPFTTSPFELASDGATLRWSDEGLVLARGGDLVALPPEALRIGVMRIMTDDINFDPYPIVADTILQPPRIHAWLEPRSAELESSDDGEAVLALRYEDSELGAFEVEARVRVDAARRFAVTLTPRSGTDHLAMFRLGLAVDTDEAFYGLGEYFDDVDHRGHVRSMQMEVDPDLESGYNEAHVPIPLMTSTEGWGLFVHSFYPGAFDVAAADPEVVDVLFGTGNDSADGWTFYLIAEDHPLDVTRHYYELTGFPVMPARWALGPWIWRNENDDQAQVVSDVNLLRELDLATTAYWIDRPYATAVNTFDFDPAMFDDAQAMIDEMHDLGFRVALWHTPYLDEERDETAELRAVADAEGYYPPETGVNFNHWGTPIDLTNPDAYAWWQSLIERYAAMGIEGYKLDYAEDIVPGFGNVRAGWVFADGSTDQTMHGLYQQFYHRVYAETLPETGGFLICRGGTIGDQVNVSVIWPGDLDASFLAHGESGETRDGERYDSVGGLGASLVAGLTLGSSGYPLYGADTGGYRHSPPDRELFMRWFQATALSPLMQVGTATSDVPWEANELNGFDEPMLDVYRDYARLHLRLWPYTWTYLNQLQQDGRSIQRPLGLAYPSLGEHPNDIFLLGDHLLAAPVVARGVTEREVTFPEGTWVDWWTGEAIEGPTTVTVDAPLEVLPLYLAADGIVPLLRPTIDAMAPTDTDVEVDSYGDDPGRLHARTVWRSEGTFDVFDGALLGSRVDGETWTLVSTTGDEMVAGVTWEIIAAAEPTEVRVGGEVVASDPEAVPGWTYVADTRGGWLEIRVDGGAQTVEVE